MTDFRPVDLPFLRAETRVMVADVGPEVIRGDIERGRQTALPEGCSSVEEQINAIVDEELARLKISELFYVSADMVSLAKSAGTSLPSFALTREDLPSPAGFIVFEDPIDDFSDYDVGPGHGTRAQIRAACWGPCMGAKGPALWITWYIDAQALAQSIDVTSYLPYRLFFCNTINMYLDGKEPFPQIDEDGNKIPLSAHSHAHWFATLKTCWVLMNQTVSSVSDAHFDRATRRRMDRADIPANRVRIITLRRRATTKGTTEAARREYHHRWIVRGHWRMQPCGPGRSIIRPTWIPPHLQGPDDGPILGGDKIYVLDR